MTLDHDTLKLGGQRITQVFQYLKELNQLRNPAKRQVDEQPWTLWMSELPSHPSIAVGTWNASSTEDLVLRVRRPDITRPPAPPPEIIEWLQPGWDNPDRQVDIHSTLNELDENGEAILVSFADDPMRVARFTEWEQKRNLWASKERPARQALQIFERLYELYGRVERESEQTEIILGDGILNWRLPDGLVRHPVLLQRLQLEFSPKVPEFVLHETDHPVELYSTLFQTESKARLVLEELTGIKTSADVCHEHQHGPRILARWKAELIEHARSRRASAWQMWAKRGRTAMLSNSCAPSKKRR